MELSKTILFYTSNSEKPEFERRVKETLLANCGGLPIISVSQKPMDLGQNICVGEIGNNYMNEFKQMLIGAKAATTDYLVFAEADFLYPPEYFSFEPSGENVYRYDSVWMVFNKSNIYHRKTYSNGASMYKRDYVVKKLEEYLANPVLWVDWQPYEWYTGNPCISFKTGDGVTKGAHTMPGPENKSHSLPYWGDAKQLKHKYLYEQ